MFYVYIIKSMKNNQLYLGSTNKLIKEADRRKPQN